MCTEPPLPVLFIYCLVHTVPAMESWSACYPHIRSVGSTGVGMERVSEYRSEFESGGGVFGRASCWGLVGYKRRLYGYESCG